MPLMHHTEYDTRLAAYAVIVRDDQLLLTWYNGEGHRTPCWTLPGGGVEFEESLPEAVAREVFEEAGYHVAVGAPMTTDTLAVADGGSGRPYKSVRVLFEATISSGTLGTTEVGGSTDFARWVPLTDLATLAPRAQVLELAIAATSGG